jgi:hypothetical protein
LGVAVFISVFLVSVATGESVAVSGDPRSWLDTGVVVALETSTSAPEFFLGDFGFAIMDTP